MKTLLERIEEKILSGEIWGCIVCKKIYDAETKKEIGGIDYKSLKYYGVDKGCFDKLFEGAVKSRPKISQR